MTTTTLARKNPLFETNVPVQYLPSSQTEQRDLRLTIRLLEGTCTSGQQTQRMYRIEFTNPEALSFLFIMDVTEEDYPTLKHEQSLLVDFNGFSQYLIELLTWCTQEESYTASIRSQGQTASGDASPDSVIRHAGRVTPTFEVVQATQFRNTNQLTLRITEANDEAVKDYLAARLSMANARNAELEALMEKSNNDTAELTAVRDRLADELSKTQQGEAATLQALRNEKDQEINRVKEEKNETVEKKQQEFESKLHEVRQQYEQNLAATSRDLTETKAKLQQETESRSTTEVHNASLKAKLDTLQENYNSLKAELEALKIDRKRLLRENRELEMTLSGTRTKNFALETQVKDRDQVITQMRNEAEESRHTRGDAREALDMTRKRCTELEGQKQELEIAARDSRAQIQALQSAATVYRTKIKVQAEALKNQEAEVLRLQEDVRSGRQQMHVVTNTVSRLEDEKTQLESQREDLKSTLQRTKEDLGQEKQMNLHLNQKLNESQAQRIMASSGHFHSPMAEDSTWSDARSFSMAQMPVQQHIEYPNHHGSYDYDTGPTDHAGTSASFDKFLRVSKGAYSGVSDGLKGHEFKGHASLSAPLVLESDARRTISNDGMWTTSKKPEERHSYFTGTSRNVGAFDAAEMPNTSAH